MLAFEFKFLEIDAGRGDACRSYARRTGFTSWSTGQLNITPKQPRWQMWVPAVPLGETGTLSGTP